MSLPALYNKSASSNLETAENTQKLNPKYPDIKVSDDGKSRTLNTADNLKELGKFYGIEFAFNKMTFEPELLKSTNSLNNSFEEVRSHLISAASRHSLPKAAIDDHLIAISHGNKFHPVQFYLDKGEWDGIERVSNVIACLNAKDKQLVLVHISSEQLPHLNSGN